MFFGKDEIESLEILRGYKNVQAFRYLRESTNAGSFPTRLAMLVAALEAMAGRDESASRVQTDKHVIKNILNDDELFDRIFKFGSGIRNQILHGGEIDETLHGGADYNYDIYMKIVNFFNATCGSKIPTDVKNPQRTQPGSFEYWQGWVTRTNPDAVISLSYLQPAFKDNHLHKDFTFEQPPEEY